MARSSKREEGVDSRSGRRSGNVREVPTTRACLSSLLLLVAITCVPRAATARVLVIGIDGASWNIVDSMIEAGELPNLAGLAKRGITADLETVEPLTSPVVWTSIATGRRPVAHGVTDFLKTRLDVRVPTVYERLAQGGTRVGLYEVLMTWPPVTLPNGFVVPGWLRRDDVVVPESAARPGGHELFRTVYEGKRSNRAYLEQARREVSEKADSWRALDRVYEPEVGALTFYAVDATSHRYWHLAYPEESQGGPADHEDERTAIFDAVRGVDRAIGRILESYGPEDTIIVLSDHGFQGMDEPNLVWVTNFDEMARQADLDPDRDGFTVLGTFFATSIRIAPGPFEERDATIAKLLALFDSYRSPDGAPLFFANAIDVTERPAGMERAWTERMWQWGLRLLTEQVFQTKIDPTAQAMVLALPRSGTLEALWPDGQVDAGGAMRPVSQVVYQQPFTGTHHPTALFIAAGGPIQPSAERTQLSVLDVAPLVLYLSGKPIPDDLEGSLPIDHLDPAVLKQRPPTRVKADALPGLPEDEASGAPRSDPALTERLRALGYLAD